MSGTIFGTGIPQISNKKFSHCPYTRTSEVALIKYKVKGHKASQF